jgi:hypothetical protein
MEESQFEPKITPEKEREQLMGQVVKSPEKAPEIIKEHLQQTPEQVYMPEHILSPEERSEIEKRINDAHYKEKEEIIGRLFDTVKEKGILNAAQIVQKLNDPSITDAFHSRLVNYLREREHEHENENI